VFNMLETREQRTDSVLCLHVKVSARLFDFRHLGPDSTEQTLCSSCFVNVVTCAINI